jgi:hypothetical protein
MSNLAEMGVQQKRDTKQPIGGVQQNETPKSGLGDQGAGMAVLEPNSRHEDRAVSTKCPRPRGFETPAYWTVETGPNWLGREDSNLRMAESKSAYFPRFVNTYSEKSSKFDRLPVNRLASCSEWGGRCSTPPYSRRGRAKATVLPNPLGAWMIVIFSGRRNSMS